MQVTRGARSLKHVWKREHIQEPPDDCVEEKGQAAYRSYVKSAWQVLKEHHENNPGSIDADYIKDQQECIEDLRDAFDVYQRMLKAQAQSEAGQPSEEPSLRPSDYMDKPSHISPPSGWPAPFSP